MAGQGHPGGGRQGRSWENSPARGSLRIPATPDAPRWARRRVRAACEGLSDEQRTIAELLTSELVTNAVRHPVRHEASAQFEIVVDICRTDQLLRVEVHDHDTRPLPPAVPPQTPSESGMGLHLVDHLASAWGSGAASTGKGKVVWFELHLSRR
jgi:sigma-B regulation protein RsbU (phosphoserine phosphatase)